MFTLYIANKNYSSWSLRAWVLMRVLGIPFQEKLVPLGTSLAERAFSPSGRVPCLVDGGTVVWDSLAIAEYLAEHFPGVWPADAAARAWARSASAEMHSGFFDLRGTCVMNCGVRVRMDDFPSGVLADVTRIDDLWNDGLSRFRGPFLAGKEFTAVDAFFAPVAFRFQTYEPKLSVRSLQYADRLLSLPSMKEWYDAALRETWRFMEFETPIHRLGTLLDDYRHAHPWEPAMSTRVLILPGIGNSGPQHWQSLWEQANTGFERVLQRDWDHPVCDEWVAGIEKAVREAGPEVVLVAHSLGSLAVAHWAATQHAPIKGALLVAVPDPDAAAFPQVATGFSAPPTPAFSFRSIVVASTNDAYATLSHAASLAKHWGSTLVSVGDRGHINGESGLGDWPDGLALLTKLMS